MTLNTSIAIAKPLPVREVYDFCARLLNTPPDIVPQESESGGQPYICNPIGIGLDAWLWINYGADGPMVDTGSENDDPDWREYLKTKPTANGWAAIEVTFDTSYGYNDNDETCSDLHARLVTALGHWLDERGADWQWQNEYTGEWHHRYEALEAFGDAHRSTGADAWFTTMALPAITAEIEAAGGPLS